MKSSFAAALAFAAVVLLHACSALAGEILTMDAAVEAALAANPEVAAAGHEYDAALARPSQAASPPDPQFMVDFIGVPTNTANVGQGTIQYMVEQQIPFPSKLVYGYKAEKRAAEAALSRRDATAQEIARQARRAWLDIWRIAEEERIGREALSILRQSKGSAEESYAALKGPVSDPVRASVQAGEIEGRLAVLEQDKLGALANLSRLVAREIDASVRLAAPPALPHVASLNDLIARAKEVRPEIGEAEKMAQSSSARVSLAKSQYAPDFVLRGGFMDNPVGLPNAWYGRAGVSFPLWFLAKQQYGVRESQASLARAHSLKEAATLSAESEVKVAYAKFMAARRTIDVYSGTVVPRARLLVRSSQEAYRDNKGDFLGIVDGIRTLADAELMLVRARVDAARALADLERAVGAPLGKEEL